MRRRIRSGENPSPRWEGVSAAASRIKTYGASLINVLEDALQAYRADRAKRLAAGLGYYALFALLPTILLAGLVAAAFVGEDAAFGSLTERLEGTLTDEAASQLEKAIADLWQSETGSGLTIVSLFALIWASSALFTAWRDMLEIVWDVKYQHGLGETIRSQVIALAVPIAAGLIVAAILILEIVVGFIVNLVEWNLVDATLELAGDLIPTVAAVFGLALLYRYTARGWRPSWHTVVPVTLATSLALAIASWCFGLYVQLVGSESVAGAASSVFIGLVLMYYYAQIMLFGAELIKVLEDRRANDSASVES